LVKTVHKGFVSLEDGFALVAEVPEKIRCGAITTAE
jgi:hypothetical protein